MGARLVVRFQDSETVKDADMPRVYLHWGGETVDEIRETLTAFIEAVNGLDDKRLNDPGYLAAKLIVWAATGRKSPGDNLLDFLSVGVVTSDDWGDGVATIICDGSGSWVIDQAIDLDDYPDGYVTSADPAA